MRKNALTPLFKILPNTILANWDGMQTTATVANVNDYTYHMTFTVERAATIISKISKYFLV